MPRGPAPDTLDDFPPPAAPHDDLPFEALAEHYNFRNVSFEPEVLARLVAKECDRRPGPVRVLDIGCGRGIARRVSLQRAIRRHADEYWGIEPDAGVRPEEGLFDHFECALMEDADLPAGTFDVMYSSMVMEHVTDPDAFMAAVHRALKPGGTYLFLTPNRRHYFARTAWILHALRLDEFVLRFVLRRKSLDEYHYPVAYRFNDAARIRARAERLGFAPPEFVYLEADGPRGYFPKPLRPIFHLLAWKRTKRRTREVLMDILPRITRPAGTTDDVTPQ